MYLPLAYWSGYSAAGRINSTGAVPLFFWRPPPPMPGPGQTVTAADWKKMAELLGDAAEADSIHAMVDRVLRHAHELWEADLVIHDRFDEQARQLAYQMYPAATSFIAGLQPAFLEFWSQHPYAGDWTKVIASGRVCFLSDRVSQRSFRQSGLWNEVYIHLVSKNQVMMGGPIETNRFWCLVLNRLGRDFGPRERELGEFLQPRLTRLFQLHARREKAQWSAVVLADANTPYLVVGPGGHILEVSAGARELFATTRTPLPADSTIPALQRIWNARAAPGTLVRQSLGNIEALATTAGPQQPAFVLLGRTNDTTRFGPLTPRESEILHWIGEGKTNAEIGALLHISPRTVAKHCEGVFGKLAVENRVGAALAAQRLT